MATVIVVSMPDEAAAGWLRKVVEASKPKNWFPKHTLVGKAITKASDAVDKVRDPFDRASGMFSLTATQTAKLS